ncbi:PQQ-binding-like beta-propeller repeat protein [Halorussus gelatinilyticus]|uniref:PQQ-binding-like beta-propeller repeat protein n=1 Tax=Halorussus gelatinilyticus TaxID=2937524 RepID=A0A8U0INM6_9EURY|nr:PQQ-binding-like beta-propeller repeat protein [Halorussus gelatinilyticus]UPW02235.1 PQQ-binding-like beta-propeller repeat protein [Halorussus gelatinilyticus]
MPDWTRRELLKGVPASISVLSGCSQFPASWRDATPDYTWQQNGEDQTVELLVTQSTVYTICYRCEFGTRALNRQTGEQEWTFSAPRELFTGTATEQVVYVAGKDGVFALDADTGEQYWHYPTEETVRTPPAVGTESVYIRSYDSTLHAVDTATGTRRWQTALSVTGGTAPMAIEDGLVYVGSVGNVVYAFDSETGRKQWTFTVQEDIRLSSTLASETLYVASENIYALNPKTGTARWEYTPKSELGSLLLVAENRVYVGGRNIVALDASSGENQWGFRLPTEEGLLGFLGLVEKTLYGWNSRYLFAFDVDRAELQWRTEDIAEYNFKLVTMYDETFYFVTHGEDIYALPLREAERVWGK